MCPRLSASDLTKTFLENPQQLMIIDLRSNQEFRRAHIDGSLNIPFTSVQLGDERIDSLMIPDLQKQLNNKIVVIISTLHENSVLVNK